MILWRQVEAIVLTTNTCSPSSERQIGDYMKNTQNTQTPANLTPDIIYQNARQGMIETLMAQVAASKRPECKNLTLVVDYIKDSEKTTSMLSSENTKSTRTSLAKYDLVHVYASDTRKQLFYIRTNYSKTSKKENQQFKFVVSPAVNETLNQNLEGVRYGFHKDYLLYVSADKAMVVFNAILDAIKAQSEKKRNKEAEAVKPEKKAPAVKPSKKAPAKAVTPKKSDKKAKEA